MEISVPSLLRIKHKALHKIGKYLRGCGYTEVAIIYGEGIKELFFPIIEISFATAEIKTLYEETARSSNIDDAFATVKNMPKAVKAIVAIGGGKAIDYCKFTGHVLQLPVISVPTVISNDGFASPLSSMDVNGKKTTVKTRIPDGVIVDTEIIRNSPEKFLYSGIGDLFCKITSVFDWKLAYKKTGEYVNDFSSVICKNAVETFIYYEKRDIANTEYLGIIVSSLLMTGVAMEIAGSSRPASGSEHLVSHAYDKLAERPAMHGIQTGVASYVMSYLQGATHDTVKSIIQRCGFADFVAQNPLSKKDFLAAVRHAPEIKENYYTILSEKDSFDRTVAFLETDELANRLLK
jgi:glycerol-1-phosphate dehydrogenase [NAD(P)+]